MTCGHSFHDECLGHWVDACRLEGRAVRCPVCKRTHDDMVQAEVALMAPPASPLLDPEEGFIEDADDDADDGGDGDLDGESLTASWPGDGADSDLDGDVDVGGRAKGQGRAEVQGHFRGSAAGRAAAQGQGRVFAFV